MKTIVRTDGLVLLSIIITRGRWTLDGRGTELKNKKENTEKSEEKGKKWQILT